MFVKAAFEHMFEDTALYFQTEHSDRYTIERAG